MIVKQNQSHFSLIRSFLFLPFSMITHVHLPIHLIDYLFFFFFTSLLCLYSFFFFSNHSSTYLFTQVVIYSNLFSFFFFSYCSFLLFPFDLSSHSFIHPINHVFFFFFSLGYSLSAPDNVFTYSLTPSFILAPRSLPLNTAQSFHQTVTLCLFIIFSHPPLRKTHTAHSCTNSITFFLIMFSSLLRPLMRCVKWKSNFLFNISTPVQTYLPVSELRAFF